MAFLGPELYTLLAIPSIKTILFLFLIKEKNKSILFWPLLVGFFSSLVIGIVLLYAMMFGSMWIGDDYFIVVRLGMPILFFATLAIMDIRLLKNPLTPLIAPRLLIRYLWLTNAGMCLIILAVLEIL